MGADSDMKYLEDVLSNTGALFCVSRISTSMGTSVLRDGTPESSARMKNWNTSLTAKPMGRLNLLKESSKH